MFYVICMFVVLRREDRASSYALGKCSLWNSKCSPSSGAYPGVRRNRSPLDCDVKSSIVTVFGFPSIPFRML